MFYKLFQRYFPPLGAFVLFFYAIHRGISLEMVINVGYCVIFLMLFTDLFRPIRSRDDGSDKEIF
jgi:hypothetical protein